MPPRTAVKNCFDLGYSFTLMPQLQPSQRSMEMTRAPSSVLRSKTTPQRRGRDLAVLAALFALMMMGLAGLAAATGWAETWEQIRALSFAQLGVLLGLSLVNYFFRAVRWHLFARTLGLPTKLMQDVRHFLGGFAMTVTPARVGELVRMRWLRRETGWSLSVQHRLSLSTERLILRQWPSFWALLSRYPPAGSKVPFRSRLLRWLLQF